MTPTDLLPDWALAEKADHARAAEERLRELARVDAWLRDWETCLPNTQDDAALGGQP